MRASDVHENRAHLSREFVELPSGYKALQQAAARHEAAYKRAFAKAYLEAEGPARDTQTTSHPRLVQDSSRPNSHAWHGTTAAPTASVLGPTIDAGRTIASTIAPKPSPQGSEHERALALPALPMAAMDHRHLRGLHASTTG